MMYTCRREDQARGVLTAALAEGRCLELLEIVATGGAATVDSDGKLWLVTNAELRRLFRPD